MFAKVCVNLFKKLAMSSRQRLLAARESASATRIRNSRKNVTQNDNHLPRIRSPEKQISQESVKVLASKSSSSLSSVGFKQKRNDNDDRLLASRISRLSIQSTPPSRKFSHRPVSGPLSVDGIASLIRNGTTQKIVIMAGAGISTASGIPDFRSPGTGLYDNLQQYKIPYPEAIFDIEYFHGNPRPFFTLAKELYPNGKYRPNYVHYFLRLLHDKGLLLRLYTQNIDGLERAAGIPPSKLVEAHGTFMTASCTRCGTSHSCDSIRAAIFSDKIPRCQQPSCRGVVKPDIVFFGEDLPQRFFLYNKDFHESDLVIVLGTSFEVEPFAGIIEAARLNVPRLLFNRELVGPFRSKRKQETDLASIGDITEEVKKFVELLGWTDELDKLVSASKQTNEIESQETGCDVTDKSADKTNHVQPTKTKDSTAKQQNIPETQQKADKSKKHQEIRSVSKSNEKSNNKSQNNRSTPFHAQKELFRTQNGSASSESSSASSGESTSSSSEEDQRK